jgi:hypothetical protein
MLMEQLVFLVGVGVVSFPHVMGKSDQPDESVKSSWTGRTGHLITQRSSTDCLSQSVSWTSSTFMMPASMKGSVFTCSRAAAWDSALTTM